MVTTTAPPRPIFLLECDPGAFYLTDTGFPAELPDKFGALGKARGTQRMALGKQTS